MAYCPLFFYTRRYFMHSEFMEALENSPVIAAVKDDDGLKNV